MSLKAQSPGHPAARPNASGQRVLHQEHSHITVFAVCCAYMHQASDPGVRPCMRGFVCGCLGAVHPSDKDEHCGMPGVAPAALAHASPHRPVSPPSAPRSTLVLHRGYGVAPRVELAAGARSPASQTWLPHTAARATRRTPASRNSWLPAAAPRASSSARVAADARRSCRGLQTLC